MMTLGISVHGGLHDGAVVALTMNVSQRVGSAADADIMLVDKDVCERQCTVLPKDGDVVALEVTGQGMAVYGTALAAGRVLDLPVGGVVMIRGVSFMVVRLEPSTADPDAPVALPCSQEEQLSARRRILRQLHWTIYAQDVISANRMLAWCVGALAGTGLLGLSVILLQADGQRQLQVRASTAAQIEQLFPAVTVRTQSSSGLSIYEGYVRDMRELVRLRTLTHQVSSGRVDVRVQPMDVLEFNAATWLEGYYQDALVEPVGPGRFKVTVGSDLAVKHLEGWDFQGISGRLMKEIPGLISVDIGLAEASQKKIILPAAQLGVSVISLEGGGTYALGRDGSPLFSGAVTQEGRVFDVSTCGLSLRTKDVGSIFFLTSPSDRCVKQQIPP